MTNEQQTKEIRQIFPDFNPDYSTDEIIDREAEKEFRSFFGKNDKIKQKNKEACIELLRQTSLC